MTRFILMALSVLSFLVFSGCAGTMGGTPTTQDNPITPYAQAAKGLRITRSGIITAARGADALCTQGVMKQKECDQAKDATRKAEAGCEAAKSAILLWLDSGDPSQYDRAAANLAGLTSSLLAIVKPYQGGAK